ncbi:PREDICTED: uncharacterized protein LOC109158152 isoform X2 [Ipomoea nil]|uniref:uncharacterized protein LOC109158152 isoform X2 n=1 Tax=Ipomoea nil TaxID=35883 RepID=UPI000901340A|nr:PREDICTED: uncharacterized protein LOC109158152 isoform X2 [Ipomoea nil]
MATAVAADTFAETAAQTKRENNDEKSIPEEVEIVLEKLLTEENKKVEIINNPHEEADEEPSKVLDKDDDDGGILKGESEGKTSTHSEDTNDGTTLQDKKSDTNEKTLSEEVERGLDKLLATEENNPQEGCDGTVEGEKMAELSSTHKAITEENYSSAEYIGKPCSKTEKEIQENLFSEGKDSDGKDFGIVLNNKGIPPYVSQGESEEKTSHSEDTNEGTTLKERHLHEEMGTLTDIVGGISENKRENDEMQPVEPEVLLDKQAQEETNIVEIDNPCESLKNNEDGNDGTAEVEMAVELPSVAKAIEEINSSPKPIENPTNTEDEILPVQPGVVLDKQAPEETNKVEIDNPCESLKNNEDGNDGTVEVEKVVDSVAKAIEEPNSSEEPIEKAINTEDEKQPVETEIMLDKQAQEETNTVEIDNPRESLKHNEDCNDGAVEVEKAVELPSVAKAIEEPNSSVEPIEKPINTEDEMLPIEPKVVLDKQALEEKNTVEIDNPREFLEKNEDNNDGTVKVEKDVDSPSAAKAIEEPNNSPGESEDKFSHSENINDGIALHENQLHEEMATIANIAEGTSETQLHEKMGTLTDIVGGISENKRENDEMQPVEPEVLLDKQAQEETNIVEIDNPCESLKNNEDGNDGTAEVEMAVELPSIAKAIEEINSSPKPIENPTNTEDEILPVQPGVVLDKQAPEETNKVEIDNPCESLKNNEDGNDGTVEVEKVVDSVAKAIEEPNSSEEPIEKAINTEDEKQPVETEIMLDKQAQEETNTVEIDNPRESLKHNEDCNDGAVEVEKAVELPSVAKAIEEPNSSVEPIEKPINTEDEMLPIEPKVVLDKQALEEKNTVEIDNPREFLEKNEDNNDGTVKVEKDVDSPSAAKAIEEPNNSPGESEDKFSHSENINDGIALHENQLHEEMATIANIAEGTSETVSNFSSKLIFIKRESDDKTLPVEAEVVFNKLVPEEKTVEFDNPHEFLKRDEGSNETVGCENVIELPSISKAIVEEHNGSQEPIGKPSKTGDEMPEKLLSKGENSDGQDMGIILNRGIPLNETQQEAEEVSNELDKDDDKGKAPEEISVQADLTENLKDSEESGEACKEQGKPFIPEGKNMDSMVVESSDDKEDERVEKEECFPQITCSDMETESAHGVDDLLSSQLVASEIKKTTLDEASPPSEVFTADLQGEINTSDNDYSNQSKILEQDTTVDGNLSTACKAQENPEKTLSDLITKHEGNLPKESEGPVSTEASRGLHTDENETTAVCEVTSQMKQHGTAETVKDDADSKNSICQNGAEKNLNAAQEEIEGSCLQQNTEPTTFSKELISEQNNEGILEGEGEDKASHSQITDEGITLQEKQLHEEVATIADIAEGTSETKKENDEKTLPDEHEVMLDKLAPDESKKVEIGNPPEISKSSEEGSDGTVECEKMIELPSVAKDTIEENNRSTEPTDNPSNTEDELSGKLFSEGENRESQPEAEEPSKALETDDDEGMPPEKTFVQADAVINCPADFTEYLKEDSEKSGEVCNENDNTQCILATKTSFPNDDSNETNAQGIADKEQDKDFIPEGENMDSLVVESHDDKEDGKVKKEESLAETCKIPLMEIQSQSSDSQDAHNVIGSPLSTSPIEETSSEKVGSSEVEPESTKASSDTMEDEFVKHDEVETETIQGVNDLLGSQLVSPEIEETGSGEGTSVSETIADPAPLIEVHGTVLKDGVHMDENKEDHQCKIIEKDNIVDDSVTVQEENITRAGEEQASEEELRGLHRDENETVVVHDVISEVEQQDTIELSKDDVDSEDSLFKYESEKENLHAPCEETEKAALPQNADQTASNEELISVKDDEVLRGESEDKAAHSDNNGETNPQETNMLTVDLDEAKSIQGNENSEWANDSTVDEKPEQQIYTATDMPTQELKYAYETNKIPEIEVLGDTSAQGQSDLDLISACPADIHVAEDTGENSNEMCLEEVADMKNQEDQIKQDGSQRAASEVRGNLSKGIENEISKDCVCSNTIIDKEESLNSRIPRGNEEEAKESKEEIKEPVKEANYHNFQTTHADTEEQVICVLTNAQNTMQSEEKMLPKEKDCHVQNFSLLKTSEENEDQISETAEPLMAATREMETELVEVQGKIAPVSSGLTSEKDVVTGNEIEVDTDETDTVPNQENDSSLNRKVNIETVAAGEDTDTREMSLHEEQIEACLSITDDKVASSLEEENPITKIVNETTIAETSSPLGTREGMVTKDILLEEEQHSVINSEGWSEKSDHIIESASEVHKLEMPLEAEKIGFVEENLAETETGEIVIKETNEENDIIKADISSEQTQIADQSVIVKSSLDYPEEVLSLDAYREVELKPEENELERLGENESIKEEASSDNKAEAEENAIKSLTQEHGETAMEMGKDGETEVQQKNLDFSFNIKDSAVENSSTETEQKDVKDNIDIIESAQEHVPGHPYELQNDEADPAKIQNDNSTDSEEKGSKNEATEAASNEAAGLECGVDAKTEVEVNKETDRSQTMESSTLSDSNLVLGSIDESSQVTEHEDTKSQTEKLCDFTHKDSEMTQPRDFPSDFTEIKNYIDDKLAQHESKVAVLDTEFPAEAYPHENTEVRTSSEGNDSQEMQQNSKAATTHNDLEEMKPENAGETKDNFEGLVFQEEKRTVDHSREKLGDTSLTQSTILQESIEQILKPKQSEDNEAENEEQIKSMQEEDETKNMETAYPNDIVQSMQEKETNNNINASQLPKEETKERRTATEAGDEASSMAGLPGASLNEREVILYKEEDEASKVETEEHEEEEEEGGEHKGEDSGPEAPVIVENAAAAGDADVKAGKKKHHNILSGVGSKVKHSIAKVKKVITGKSSPTKQQSPK